MSLTRRELMKQAGALGLLGGGIGRLARAGERLIPWHNWSGAQVCIPAARLAPNDEGELAGMLKAAKGPVRAVGSGHSFSALVPTDGTLLSLSNMSGMIGSDASRLQSEFWAGTRVADMGEPLRQAGLAMPNMADIDYQTIAGAIATSTHGTGPKFGSYSTQVAGLRLVTAGGEVLDLDAQHQPELFNAARVSLGALGVVTRVRLQNRKAFRLHQKQWVQKTEDLLEDIDRLIRENDHFEFNAIIHSDVAVAQAQNETTETATMAKAGGGDGDALGKLAAVDTYLRNSPDAQAAILNFMVKHIDFPDVIDDSYKVFANVRDQRFNEMEYEVPAAAGPACVREVIKTIRQQNLRGYIPIEYRYVKGDDIPLSMFSGRDTCAISVHQFYDLDYHNFFAQIEPIFWKYEGRPHWGKLHTLNAAQFSRLYPRFKEFLDIRQSLDPSGKFLNAHLRSVFGINC